MIYFPGDINEERSLIIGKVGRVLFVVFALRTDAIRIISARKATKEEERLYDENLYS